MAISQDAAAEAQAANDGIGVVLRTWSPASEGGRNQSSWLERQTDWPDTQLLNQCQMNKVI